MAQVLPQILQYVIPAGIVALIFGYNKVAIACLVVVAVIALNGLRYIRWTAKRLLVLAGIVAIASPFAWMLISPYFIVREEANLPSDPSSFQSACTSPGIAYLTAAAYEGPAPHPIILPLQDNELKDLPSVWRPDSVAKVQLIACSERVGGNYHKSCQYRFSNFGVAAPNSAPYPIFMDEGVYTVTLFDLRTHRKVAQTTLVGMDDKCPNSAAVSMRSGKSYPEKFYTQPTAAQYVEAFSSYVEK